MARLNAPQKAAVQYINGPLLVLAGAGTGKTSVITHKIAWLIREFGIAPQHIAAVTFTNKAAREMKTRAADMLGGDIADDVSVSTFHSLGLNLLRNHLQEAGLRAGFSIYDADDSLGLISKLVRAEFSGRNSPAERVRWQISQWKNALLMPERIGLGNARRADGEAAAFESLAARVYAEYERQLRAYNALDFDDLIVRPVHLFEEHSDILADWRDRIRYLLVDEYQDTNACQYVLVRLLVGERGALTAVGDDDQSIYAWRGARPENLHRLQHDYPNLNVIKLEQNYRSTRRILSAANNLIANNPHLFVKALWCERGPGEPLRVIKARSEEHEAERVVSELQFHKFRHNTEFRDYAILFRENHQARVFERVLREQRIPYFLSGASSFFDRTEIKDIMAYLRLLTNPDDDSAFLRVVNTPRREIGAATLEQLGQHAAVLGTSLLRASMDKGLEARLGARQVSMLRAFTDWLSEMVNKAAHEAPARLACSLLAELHYEDWLKDTCNDRKIAQRRMENVFELLAWLERLARRQADGATLADLVSRLSLIGMLERDGEDNPGDYVSLMTLHSAKGLEFPHVFIVGAEEGLLPHRNSISAVDAASGEDDVAVCEERRLAYVGITRAQQTLTLSYAEQRRRGGEIVAAVPSRFLDELPPDDVRWAERDAGQDPPQAMAGRAELYLKNLRSLLGNQ